MTQANLHSCTRLYQDDPLRDRIFSVATELIAERGEITIQEVIDASNITESPVRLRISELVAMGKLICAQGIGRRPNYYFFPVEKIKTNYGSDDMRVIEEIEQEEVAIQEKILLLQKRLKQIAEDKAVIERSYQIKNKLMAQQI